MERAEVERSVHGAFRTLPEVDVAGLYSNELELRREAARALVAAGREAGFFYLTGHSVSADLRAELLAQARAFFSQSTAQKLELYIGKSANHRGYVPPGEETFYDGARDQKESFDLCFERCEPTPSHPFAGPNVWPPLPGFRDVVSRYYDAVFELGERLLQGFALGLDLPETFFDRFVTAPPSQLRMLHYPQNPAPDVTVGIGAHTDYECFTILLPTAPGLEVMNGAGEWIDAPPRPGAFVVNLGDTLEMWTNGQLVATSHRVRKVSVERYAFPLFFACDYHVEVQPLPCFVSAERPARYPPLKAGEHLYAQTLQSFGYLKQRLARGELVLPSSARPLSSFGQAGKLIYHGADGD
jgi:isopenicillin N synthase-like dioxygenase